MQYNKIIGFSIQYRDNLSINQNGIPFNGFVKYNVIKFILDKLHICSIRTTTRGAKGLAEIAFVTTKITLFHHHRS